MATGCGWAVEVEAAEPWAEGSSMSTVWITRYNDATKMNWFSFKLKTNEKKNLLSICPAWPRIESGNKCIESTLEDEFIIEVTEMECIHSTFTEINDTNN